MVQIGRLMEYFSCTFEAGLQIVPVPSCTSLGSHLNTTSMVPILSFSFALVAEVSAEDAKHNLAAKPFPKSSSKRWLRVKIADLL